MYKKIVWRDNNS